MAECRRRANIVSTVPPAIQLTLDHRIRCRVRDIPDELDDALIEALCIPNLAREKAREQHQWGWEDLPEEIPMYGLSVPPRGLKRDAVLDMPRGFLPDLLAGFETAGVLVEIIDNRTHPTIFRCGRKITKREHQDAAIRAILDAEDGIYKAPPGSGKTVVVLQAGRIASTSCIVIVNTKDIMYQWVDRIHEHLGEYIPVGLIGDGHFDVEHTWTIAVEATLNSRFDALEEDGFFDRFGFMCLDECHHCQAETYLKVIDRFSSKCRIGVSATPSKTGDFLLAQMTLGPLIHTTRHEGLVEAGHLLKPTIVKVKTNFKHKFRGTTSRWSRTNYPDVLNALMRDDERNEAIVSAIMRESGHHCLVLTKRHEHIDILEALLNIAGYEFPIYRLTGKEKGVDRQDVIKRISESPGCVFSTVADEALDIPRVDRLFLVYPQRNVELIEQQIGRVERTHPEKADAIVTDFADLECGPMKAQWTARYMGLYKRRGFRIIRRTVEDYV